MSSRCQSKGDAPSAQAPINPHPEVRRFEVSEKARRGLPVTDCFNEPSNVVKWACGNPMCFLGFLHHLEWIIELERVREVVPGKGSGEKQG